ncbi:hypothetical protein Btru_072065 [Bulinus truncatus]|nr:hypothetical protein Btru_072065 [Bulinus truncatus]
MNVFERRLCLFAFYSRLFIILLQFVANFLLPDHDAKVFNPPPEPNDNSWIHHLITCLFGGLQRWDAIYFTHIIQYGYTYENSVAFFPLYPLVVASLAKVVSFGVLNFRICVLLMGIVLNIALFVVTSLLLYRLGKMVLKTDKIAFYASLLFCINPASIFMSAVYSEIMYTFFLIAALVALNMKKKIISSFLLGLSIFTRSNGLAGIGFIVHNVINSSINQFCEIKSASSKLSNLRTLRLLAGLMFKTVLEIIFYSSLCAIPFFIFQYYVYHLFCQEPPELPKHVIDYGRSQGYKIAGDEPSPWCNATIPLSYSYIQKHHWNVGFLKYYTFKQMPNFLLAFPVVLLSIRTCMFYFQLNPLSFYCLGFRHSSQSSKERFFVARATKDTVLEEQKKRKKLFLDKIMDDYADCQWDEVNSNKVNSSSSDQCIDLIVYVCHLTFLTVFGCFFMHIQVLTRMLFSSSPLLYWYASTLFINGNRGQKLSRAPNNKRSGSDCLKQGIIIPHLLQSLFSMFKLSFISEAFKNWYYLNFEFRAIFIYFLTYFFLGTIMFSNFLPWT